jgi:hypothetical protein
MSKRQRGFYEAYRPRKATSDLIKRVLAVLAEYGARLPLTIRQIFLPAIREANAPSIEDERAGLIVHRPSATVWAAMADARKTAAPHSPRAGPSGDSPPPTA